MSHPFEVIPEAKPRPKVPDDWAPRGAAVRERRMQAGESLRSTAARANLPFEEARLMEHGLADPRPLEGAW